MCAVEPSPAIGITGSTVSARCAFVCQRLMYAAYTPAVFATRSAPSISAASSTWKPSSSSSPPVRHSCSRRRAASIRPAFSSVKYMRPPAGAKCALTKPCSVPTPSARYAPTAASVHSAVPGTAPVEAARSRKGALPIARRSSASPSSSGSSAGGRDATT
jgi:hypothetical protein